MDFADWLRQQLRQRGWSQAELARRGGVQPSTVSQVLNGTRGVGPDFCLAVARALRVPAEEVYRVADLLPPVPEDEIARRQSMALKEVWAVLKRMDEEQLAEVERYARYLVETEHRRPTPETE